MCRRRTFVAVGCTTCPPPSVCSADDSRSTNGCPHTAVTGSVEEQLRQPPLAGVERVAVEQRHRRHDFRGADVQPRTAAGA